VENAVSERHDWVDERFLNGKRRSRD